MATYYVRPTNGSDAAAGTSYAAAFQTTQKAADTAVAGDTVYLCAEAVELITAKIDMDTNAGTAITPIRFVAANGSGTVDGTVYTIRANAAITAVIDFAAASDYTFWSGVDFDANSLATYALYNNVDGSDYHFFTKCRFQKATSHGVFVRGAMPWVLLACEVDHNGGCGVAHSAANRGTVVVEFGSIHHNTSHGWLLDRYGCRCLVTRVYRNGGDGINMASNSNGSIVHNCTVFNNGGDGIELYNSTTRNSYEIINTTLCNNANYGVRFQTGDSNTAILFDHNHTDGNVSGASDLTLPGLYNKTGSPLFTSTADGSEDFAPTTGSPLIDSAIDGGDIGAVQSQPGASSGGVDLPDVMMVGA